MLFVLSCAFLLSCNSSGVAQEKTPADSSSMVTLRSARDPWFGTDKAKHFAASAFVTGVSFLVLHEAADMRRRDAAVSGGVLALAIGIGKETHDGKRRKGRFSFKDLVADVAGIGVAFVLVQTL